MDLFRAILTAILQDRLHVTTNSNQKDPRIMTNLSHESNRIIEIVNSIHFHCMEKKINALS